MGWANRWCFLVHEAKLWSHIKVNYWNYFGLLLKLLYYCCLLCSAVGAEVASLSDDRSLPHSRDNRTCWGTETWPSSSSPCSTSSSTLWTIIHGLAGTYFESLSICPCFQIFLRKQLTSLRVSSWESRWNVGMVASAAWKGVLSVPGWNQGQKEFPRGFVFLYHLLSALSVLYTLNPHITQEGLDEIGPSEPDRKTRSWSGRQSFGF